MSMTTPADRFGLIRLSAAQLQRSELLMGLDLWLQLGLLSPQQVQLFCREYLTCALPNAVNEVDEAIDAAIESGVPANRSGDRTKIAPDGLPVPVAAIDATPATEFLTTEFANDFADTVADTVAEVEPVPTPARPNWVTQTLQAFMAEIGVIWLLCLGVFMVVVSSGVLAASQWENFTAIGQYGILATYTLAFWGASLWTSRSPALRLTSRMLQITTLLIVPVNFWMMDGLSLWQSGVGVGISLLSALALSAISVFLVPKLSFTADRLILINVLGLSWLHWGWAIAGIPLIAIYIGTIGTAGLTYWQLNRSSRIVRTNIDENDDRSSDDQNHDYWSDDDSNGNQLSVLPIIITLATLLLLGRAILAAQVPLNQLGLAFGVCGWLFCWRNRSSTVRSSTVRSSTARSFTLSTTTPIGLWTKVGVGLLVWGWLISVEVEPPWQAFAVSGLGLWLLGDRLRRSDSQPQLVALLLLGLQTYWLLWRFLPIGWRDAVIATATQGFGAAGMPIVILSLLGFPYLWLMLGLARKLRRRAELAQTTELLALGLGFGLTLLSLFNLGIRAFTLTLSALTLSLTLRHRSLRSDWIYFNHVVILAAIAAWIDWIIPAATALIWARILLIGVAIEWMISVLPPVNQTLWRQSCWHLGLGLAGLSYVLLYSNGLVDDDRQNLIWLITPILLTGLSQIRSFPQPQLAAWISAGSLIAQLFLQHSITGWMMATAVATGLMIINQRTLRHLLAAFLTIGFALGFEAVTLYRYFPDYFTFDWGLLWLASNFALLWLIQDALVNRGHLSQLYALAIPFWAGTIGFFSLISLSLHSLIAYTWIEAGTMSPQLVISSSLIAIATAYQLWRRGGTNLGFYGLAWACELVAATLIGWQDQSIDSLAIVTLAFGLVSQLAADFWIAHQRETFTDRRSWHLIPLLYAGLGLFLGHHAFTATTGLYTVAAALIGIGVGRRTAAFKPLTLGALGLSSIGFYELLIYQLSQGTGAAGDGVTLLAGLALLIASVDRLAQRWLLPYLRLSSASLAWVAHLHWGLGSGLGLFTLFLPLSDRGLLIWLLVGSLLTVYALLHGRATDRLNQSERWTDLGILAALIVGSDFLYRTIPNTELLLTWAGTLAAIAAIFLYFSPWHRWGWPQRPWCRMAIGFPGAIVLLTAWTIGLQSLLIVAAFYAWIAKAERQPRISYFGLFLFDWAALRFLATEGWLTITWISALIALSLLYIAQLDPTFQDAREKRHWLRFSAIALLSLTLFYQAETELAATALTLRLLTLGWAIGLLFIGLVLRVRAFLYVGTLTFIVQVLRFLWLFINTYALLLWAIGILIGLIFIWIAATFEARRSQMGALVQYWLSEFADWE